MKQVHLIPVFLFSIFILQSQAQTKTKLSFGASVNPLINIAFNQSNSDQVVNPKTGQTYQSYIDSTKSLETFKLSLGATVWCNYLVAPKWVLQAGVGYSEVGFVRNQKNIQYKDPFYPGMGTGKLEELSNSEKNIQYRYRFQYLTIPVLFNYSLGRSADYKWNAYFTLGASLNILLNHEMKAQLQNFVIDDVKTFKFDSTGLDARSIVPALFLGSRFDYKVEKGLGVFFQPAVTFYPLSVTSGAIKSNPLGFQMNIGFTYVLGSKDE